MIITNIEGLRDPFILVDNGVYYLYGTGDNGDNTIWACYVNDSGSLHGEWKRTENLVYEIPKYATKQFWAPEVHKYKGAYYMFCTYYSSFTQHRGCTVLKSDSPTGPFVEISGGHITPKNWDAIDATLFVDRESQPWMVFVHEWTCTEDGVGRMVAAKMSADLSRLESEPVELFRADSPSWTDRRITDGCFLYTTQNGNLLMLWSNLEKDGYCIGIAHSKDGLVDGEWTHETAPIYKRGTADHHDGGHGMIFTDTDGQLYLCLHSPNKSCEECSERTVLIPIRETNDTLACVLPENVN